MLVRPYQDEPLAKEDTESVEDQLDVDGCREIGDISVRLVQEGRQELCITQHSNFSHLANLTVLEQVGPLLKDKNGRSYRRIRN